MFCVLRKESRADIYDDMSKFTDRIMSKFAESYFLEIWSKLCEIGRNWLKMIGIGRKMVEIWRHLVENYQKLVGINLENWSTFVGNCSKVVENGRYCSKIDRK